MVIHKVSSVGGLRLVIMLSCLRSLFRSVSERRFAMTQSFLTVSGRLASNLFQRLDSQKIV